MKTALLLKTAFPTLQLIESFFKSQFDNIKYLKLQLSGVNNNKLTTDLNCFNNDVSNKL